MGDNFSAILQGVKSAAQGGQVNKGGGSQPQAPPGMRPQSVRITIPEQLAMQMMGGRGQQASPMAPPQPPQPPPGVNPGAVDPARLLALRQMMQPRTPTI